MQEILLQNATAILLQNATEVYYKMRQFFYYKMRRLLQIATVHLSRRSSLASLFLMKACMGITKDWEASIKL